MNKTLALFDLDGTLTRSDSFFHFLRHSLPLWRLCLGACLLWPVLAGYRLGVMSNARAKALVVRHFYSGWSEERFAGVGESFAREVLPGLMRPGALECLNAHREKGHRVVVVSASLGHWVRPWAHAAGVEILSTEAEVEAGRLTGRFATPNCYGPEKVRRVREILDPARYETIYAYGDSSGDREMLALAHRPHFKPFRGEGPCGA